MMSCRSLLLANIRVGTPSASNRNRVFLSKKTDIIYTSKKLNFILVIWFYIIFEKCDK